RRGPTTSGLEGPFMGLSNAPTIPHSPCLSRMPVGSFTFRWCSGADRRLRSVPRRFVSWTVSSYSPSAHEPPLRATGKTGGRLAWPPRKDRWRWPCPPLSGSVPASRPEGPGAHSGGAGGLGLGVAQPPPIQFVPDALCRLVISPYLTLRSWVDAVGHGSRGLCVPVA